MKGFTALVKRWPKWKKNYKLNDDSSENHKYQFEKAIANITLIIAAFQIIKMKRQIALGLLLHSDYRSKSKGESLTTPFLLERFPSWWDINFQRNYRILWVSLEFFSLEISSEATYFVQTLREHKTHKIQEITIRPGTAFEVQHSSTEWFTSRTTVTGK